MSDRKLFGVLTGPQITFLGALAIITPGAVYAVANTPVVITDPNTGAQNFVDAGRRLYVYDPIAGYQNNSLYFVRLSSTCLAGSNNLTYSPPSGKAMVIRAVDFAFYEGKSGSDNYVYLLDNIFGFVAGVDSPDPTGSKNSNLGNGIYVKNGESLSLECANPGVYMVTIAGYLVPSNAVPALATSEAVGQSVHSASPLMKNGKAL